MGQMRRVYPQGVTLHREFGPLPLNAKGGGAYLRAMKVRYFFSLICALCAALLVANPAFAQMRGEVVTTGGVLPASMSGSIDPADRLASSLRLLSQNPYDVTALSQAGESALAVGDANAAISFLARAEELSPTSGRIKASLASALVMVERPAESLRLFREALALGVPEHQIAKDRGLAFDLTGDFKRAQKDYSVALRHGSDEEVTRRLALSLGISGDKDQALKVLEPLIRQKDQAAWRARAFILAMNGDVRGADKIAEQVAPAPMVNSLSQFMRKLAALTPAQRASAVNFGTVPSAETRYASAQASDPFRPIAEGALAGLTPEVALLPSQAPVLTSAAVQAQPLSKSPRRRPGRGDAALSSVIRAAPAQPVSPAKPQQVALADSPKPSWNEGRLSRRVGERIGPVDPERLPDVLRAPDVLKAGGQAIDKQAAPVLIQTSLTSLPPPSAADTMPAPVATVAAGPAVDPLVMVTQAALSSPALVVAIPPQTPPAPSPGFSGPALSGPELPSQELPSAELPSPALSPPELPAPALSARGLLAVISSIEVEAESRAGPVMSDAEFRKARLAVKRKAVAEEAKLAEGDAATKLKVKADDDKKRLAVLHPARLWVQVATGANEAGLSRTLSRLREQAPAALKTVGGASVPFKSTNRVLVGPFKSAAEARAVLTKLTKAGVSATTFNSTVGQEVTKLPSR